MARTTAKQVKTASQINDNWLAGMQSPTAQAKYRQGISNFTGNPMANAATDAAMAKYQNNVAASVASGKRRQSLESADPAMWKNNALNVGAVGLGTGAAKKKAKHLKRMQAWQAVYQQASNAAAAVADDGGINAGKWQAAVQILKQAKGKT